MKKLLSILTVTILVSTSTNDLKPLFINNGVSHSFKSKQVNQDINIQLNRNNINAYELTKINNTNNIKNIIVTTSGTIYADINQKLCKSTDGAITFSAVLDLPNEKYYNCPITATVNGTVYVGTLKGLYKSTNGTSFEKFSNGIPSDTFISSLTVDSNNIYAGTSSSGIYKSNGTDAFKPMEGKVPATNVLTVDSNNNIYAGTMYSGVYKSNGTNAFKPMEKINGGINTLTTDKDGNIYAGKNTGLYKSNGTDAFKPMKVISEHYITNLAADNEGNVYVGADNDNGAGNLYKSNTDGNFELVNGWSKDNDYVSSLTVNKKDGTIYVGTKNKGLYVTNPINLLIKIDKPNTFDKSLPLYNGIVYNCAQKIDIKDKLVETATLDGNSITVPTKNLDLQNGEHTLTLTLKDKSLASVFGGDPNTGQVEYKLWVKTKITDTNKIYSTNNDDTKLLSGLVSNAGNTNGYDIIQTKSKHKTGTHNAFLNLEFDDILIDYPNSFYVQGTVNEKTNDFTEVGTRQTFSKNLNITTDGIYHLYLVDTVGNTYGSYLELGKSNWKLQGEFDDKAFYEKAKKMNVTVDVRSPSKEVKQETNTWLNDYQELADSTFSTSVQEYGKGFDIKIADFVHGYKSFLDPVTYLNPQTEYSVNQKKLNDEVTNIANKKLQVGLNTLPQKLNVDTTNVVNKSTLDSYTSWIQGYNTFINKNKDQWISNIVNVASRGFATKQQEQDIKNHILKLSFENYLQHLIWNKNVSLGTSNDYLQFIELSKLQSDTISWVNQYLPEMNQAYQNTIKLAESGLNLHGYSIENILHGKQKPQTKSEIENFVGGKSYHDWLQSQATIKFDDWQLKIGFYISLPILGIIIIVCWFFYLQFSVKHNPARKAFKTNEKHTHKKNTF